MTIRYDVPGPLDTTTIKGAPFTVVTGRPRSGTCPSAKRSCASSCRSSSLPNHAAGAGDGCRREPGRPCHRAVDVRLVRPLGVLPHARPGSARIPFRFTSPRRTCRQTIILSRACMCRRATSRRFPRRSRETPARRPLTWSQTADASARRGADADRGPADDAGVLRDRRVARGGGAVRVLRQEGHAREGPRALSIARNRGRNV